ncbi:programmed cell death protein 1-like isoform X1 [Acipenser oxyrinchus oxyrinchus]|uniref:Programmed cell death protein 1-like isoform X1 n=1 Tax=Acipenser oxyrinchus oxyrinchus TaxID=40147 RepID=A0AAD8DET3_ACIOX|nr:programmed cell death protein 1-like isoform X1 [Acipenser oxyrinchus oxyrinchus]
MSRVPNKLLAILVSLMSFLCTGLGIEKSGSTHSDPGDSQPSKLNFSSKEEGQILTLNFTFPKKLSATESMNLNLKKNQQKIAEINFKGGQGNKFNEKRLTFTWQEETQTVTLSISGLIKNDSGVYQCNYVLNSKIEVSNSINLTVRTKEGSYTNQTDLSDPASTADSHPQDHSIPQNALIAASVSVTALLLLVLSITVFLIWDRNKGMSHFTRYDLYYCVSLYQDSNPSQAVPVYSIKYGVLEFPRRDALPPAMMPDHTDHVEYATISFPAGQEGSGKHCWSHGR